MDDLRNWFNRIETHKDGVIEGLLEEFPNILQTIRTVDNHEDSGDDQDTNWELCGNVLCKEVSDKFNSSINSGDKVSLVLNNERFEGYLDPEGNGYGILKKINTKNGLYEFLVEGKFVKGHLDGKIKERKSCTFVSDCFYSNGIRHGPYRKLDLSKKLLEIGFYVEGLRFGPFCAKYPGGCYVIGHKTEESNLESCAFIYPNLEDAIYGKFELKQNDKTSHVKVIEGHYVKIVDASWDTKFPIPVVKITHSELLTYEPSTDSIICKNTSLSEPYEENSVVVARSKESNAGEGLYSKRSIEKGKVVSFYNGVRYLKGRSERGKSYKSSDYRVSLDKFTDLDIPLKYCMIENYRATLGHKACHSFDESKVNAKFENFHHPRFGQIIALVTTCDISTEDEILVNYNYKSLKKAPNWYKTLWKSNILKSN